MKSIQGEMLICFLLLLLSSCNKDIPGEEVEPLELEFNVFYTINGDTLIDSGSKIFVYYGINQSNVLNFYIQNDGRLIDSKQSSNIIFPNVRDSINHTGIYTLTPPMKTENLLVIVWSNFYKERSLKSLFTEYDFYYHGSNQLIKIYFMEKNHGIE